MLYNGKLDGFVSVTVIVAIVGTPHGVPLLSGFVGFHQAEAGLIKNY